MKLLGALLIALICAPNARATFSPPPFFGVTAPATSVSTTVAMYLSGTECVAASSTTAGTCNVLLNGTTSASAISINALRAINTTAQYMIAGSTVLSVNWVTGSPEGTSNIKLGLGAGANCNPNSPLGSCEQNQFIGDFAGGYSTNTSQSIFIGDYAGLNLTNAPTSSVFIGPYAGNQNGSAFEDVCIGPLSCNGAVGAVPVQSNGTNTNVAVGYNAAPSLSSGTANVCLGAQSCLSTAYGSNNIAIGNVGGIFGAGSNSNVGINGGRFLDGSNGNIDIGYVPATAKQSYTLGIGSIDGSNTKPLIGGYMDVLGSTKQSSVTINGFFFAQSSVTASAFFGDGSHLSGVDSGNTVSSSWTVTGAGGILTTSSVTASAFFGSASGLTALPTANLKSGPLPTGVTISTVNVSPGFNAASNFAQITSGGNLPIPNGVTASTGIFSSTLTVQGNAFSVGGSTFVVIGGAVGIGSTVPNPKSLTLTGDYILFADPQMFVGDNGLISGSAADGNSRIDYFSSKNFYLTRGGGGQNVLTADSSGNVGIGVTNTASTRLFVSGTSTQRVFVASGAVAGANYISGFYNGHDTAGDVGIVIAVGANGTDSTSSLIAFRDGGDNTAQGSITRGGANGSVLYNVTSDRRLKHNIVPTAMSLSDLLKLRVVDFNYNSDKSSTTMTGLIAQEAVMVFPNAVSKTDDGVTTLAVKSKPWGMDYGRLTPLLIKAIQDQQREIEKLQDELWLMGLKK